MSGVLVNGVDLEAMYGLVLTGDSEFKMPVEKSYLLDRPGGDGSLDVTEVFGDVLYNDRQDILVFSVQAPYGAEAFEAVKTNVARFLHGRTYDYTLPHDPGYTYHGRFSIDEAYMRMYHRLIKIKVTANPYKSAGYKTHVVDAQAGAHLTLLPGRGRVQPVFESKMPIHVIANGVDAVLPAGSHTAVGLSIRDGEQEVYVNTGGSIRGGNTTWGDIKEKGLTWGDLKKMRWHELMYLNGAPAPSGAYKVKIAYEVKEL